jgi:hypothetical protein
VFDGEARIRPGMKDTDLRKKVIGQLLDPVPGYPILLTASSERAAPEVGDVVTECLECATVRRHGVIRKEVGQDLPQPIPLFGDWLMPSPSHLLFDFLKFRSHAVATGFSLQREAPAA